MTNLTSRILLAGIALPLLIIIVLFCPWFHHGCFNLILIVFSFLGGMELTEILNKKGFSLRPLIGGFLSCLSPLAAYLEIMLPRFFGIFPLIFILAGALIMVPQGLPRQEEGIPNTLMRFPGYLSLLIYPGLFLSYITRLTAFEQAGPVILLFLAMVFSNDSFAYIFGMLFGKNNRGIFRVSPKKSLAGVIGGLAGAVAASYILSLIFPALFQNRLLPFIAALGTGALAIAGDLIESAIKRSAGVKDSGTLLMGRGGVMDSLDSLLFAAPFYYYFMRFFETSLIILV